jgi:hypothetical protein
VSGLALTVLPGRLAVCRLPDRALAPAPAAPLGAVIRRGDELTVVCAEEDAPADASSVQGGWRALEVAGPFDLTSVVGVLASLAGPLADAGVSVFVVSTFDTDVLLVQEGALDAAVAALRAAGHSVRGARGDAVPGQ